MSLLTTSADLIEANLSEIPAPFDAWARELVYFTRAIENDCEPSPSSRYAVMVTPRKWCDVKHSIPASTVMHLCEQHQRALRGQIAEDHFRHALADKSAKKAKLFAELQLYLDATHRKMSSTLTKIEEARERNRIFNSLSELEQLEILSNIATRRG